MKRLLAPVVHLCIPCLVVALLSCDGIAQKMPDTASAENSGQHDFDFEMGTWKTHLKRLQKARQPVCHPF